MPMDPQLRRQLKQICCMSFGTATANEYGEIQVGSVATFYCRLETRTRHVERMDGTFEVTRQPLLILDSTVNSTGTPDFDTRIWLPGVSPTTAAYARKAKNIHVCVDEFGRVAHYELEV